VRHDAADGVHSGSQLDQMVQAFGVTVSHVGLRAPPAGQRL
jgi:hypothetical protein